MKPIIGITHGDFNGIGPEVALKAVTSNTIRRQCVPVLIGSMDVFEWWASRLSMKISFREVLSDRRDFNMKEIPVINLKAFHRPRIQVGKVSAEALDLEQHAAVEERRAVRRGNVSQHARRLHRLITRSLCHGGRDPTGSPRKELEIAALRHSRLVEQLHYGPPRT